MLRQAGKGICYIEYVFMGASALAVILMMLLTVVNVVLRYLLGSPLGWQIGLLEDYLMLGLFYLGLSYTFRVGGHVSVDAFIRRLPDRSRHVLAIVGDILACVFFAAIVYTGALFTWEAWIANEVPSGGGTLPWPTWTSNILIPLGTALLVTRILYSAVAGESRRDQYDETTAI